MFARDFFSSTSGSQSSLTKLFCLTGLEGNLGEIIARIRLEKPRDLAREPASATSAAALVELHEKPIGKHAVEPKTSNRSRSRSVWKEETLVYVPEVDAAEVDAAS